MVKLMSRTLRLAAGIAVAALLPGMFAASAPAADGVDAAAIRSVIGSTWDKPGEKVDIGPIIIAGDHAVAAWTQSGRGGRALLRRNGGNWTVQLCSGDPIKEAAAMSEAGVPPDEAAILAAELAAEEAKVPAERRALFATFGATQSVEGMHGPENSTHGNHENHK